MKAKILIADDSAYMRTILKEILIRNSYIVAGEAENGREAVELYDKLRPDVVTLDISMPEMDGIEALKAIREAHSDARVVMAATMGQQDLVIDAIRAGAMEFFIKPIQSEQLIEALEKVHR